MKKVTLIAFIGIVLLIGSCAKKQTIKSVENDIVEGSWKITLYEEDGVNETANYSGFVFTFKDDGTVAAVSSTTTVNGNWSTYKDDDHVDFDLILPVPLDNLSDDWEIIGNSSSALELKDVSGGDGSIDYLTFKKI